MKKFSSFLNEAQRSFASQEAEKLKLTHVGYGKYADVRGNVTHMSKQGKLVKLAPQEQGGQKQGGQEEEGGSKNKVDQGEISITFGRFNPPTVGHEALIKKVAAQKGDYRIYPSRSEDAKKNPLDVGTKIKFMKQAYPDHSDNIINNDEMRTIFDVLTTVNGEGYSTVNIVVSGDRVSEFNSLATKYNGDLYNFKKINVVSAGDRDPDAEGIEGMSASKLRKAAAQDDYETFKSGCPKPLGKKGCQDLFKAVQSAMKVEVKEDFAEASYLLYEIAPKLDPQGLREAYFEKDLHPVGSYVENINTGVVGKVVSRGANYVIYVDEEENVFRSWLKDLTETDYTKPSNREFGTDSLTNYVRSITPGEFLKKINKKEKVTVAAK